MNRARVGGMIFLTLLSVLQFLYIYRVETGFGCVLKIKDGKRTTGERFEK